uniref:Titin n=1 Tax=Oryzias latipes TaxID=8090 RepID=A0A3B3HB65_ORYLA
MKGELELGNTINRDIKNTPTKAIISVKEAKLSDGGQYTLLLKNPGGEKVVHVNVVVLDKPGEPQGPVVVTGINNDQCCLSWKPPLNDGGSTVSHYIVKRRETSRLVWTVVDPKVETTGLKITKLLEGDEYIFRVYAVNQFGVGAPLESAPVLIKDPCLPPSSPKNVEVSEIKKDSMVLNWETPSETGGSPIIGYIIEKHDKEGDEYLFRVTAINDKGKSDPKALTGPVMTKDLVFEPDIRPAFSSYSVHVRKNISVDIPIFGRPKPTVTWTKDGAPLKFTTRVNILSTPSNTTLNIKEAAIDDGGMYCISATNAVGKKETTIEIIILDKPGPPSGPVRFEEITTQSVTMSWDPPKYNGGCQISNYIVQKRNTTTTTWENVSINWARTTIKVTKLTTGTEYQFRIIAQNRYGKSQGLDSSSVVAQYPYKEPASDEVEAPKASIDPGFTKTITINAGQTFKIDADVRGKPLPTMQWFKEEKMFDMKNYPKNTVYVRAGSNLTFDIPLRGKPMPKVTVSKNNIVIKASKR